MSMTTNHIAAALSRAGIKYVQLTEECPYRHHFIGDNPESDYRPVVTVTSSGTSGIVYKYTTPNIADWDSVSRPAKLVSVSAIVAFMRDCEAPKEPTP